MKKTSYYLKKSRNLTHDALKGGGIFKVYVLWFISLILNYSALLTPIGNISRYEMYQMIRDRKPIEVTKCFKGCENYGYLRLLAANILKGLIILATILTIVIIPGTILGLFGTGIMMISGKTLPLILCLVPVGILVLVYLVMLPFIQVENAYIKVRFRDSNITSILYNSFNGYKNGGRLKMFILHLHYSFALTIPVAVISGIVALFAIDGSMKVLGIGLVIGALLSVILLVYIPLISVHFIVSKGLLLDDIVENRTIDKKSEVKSFDNVMINKKDKNQVLNILFDVAEDKDESYIDSLNNLGAVNNMGEVDDVERVESLEGLDSKYETEEEMVEYEEETKEDVLDEEESLEQDSLTEETEEALENDSVEDDNEVVVVEEETVDEESEVVVVEEQAEEESDVVVVDEATDEPEAETEEDTNDEANEEAQEESTTEVVAEALADNSNLEELPSTDVECPYCNSVDLMEIGTDLFMCNECKNKFVKN